MGKLILFLLALVASVHPSTNVEAVIRSQELDHVLDAMAGILTERVLNKPIDSEIQGLESGFYYKISNLTFIK